MQNKNGQGATKIIHFHALVTMNIHNKSPNLIIWPLVAVIYYSAAGLGKWVVH